MSSNFSTAPISKRSIHLLPLHHHSGRAGLGNRCTFYSVPPSSRPSPIEAANAHPQPLSSDTLHSRYQKVLADKTLQQHIAVIDAATGKAYTHGTLQQDSTQLAQILLDQNPPAASPPLIGILS